MQFAIDKPTRNAVTHSPTVWYIKMSQVQLCYSANKLCIYSAKCSKGFQDSGRKWKYSLHVVNGQQRLKQQEFCFSGINGSLSILTKCPLSKQLTGL